MRIRGFSLFILLLAGCKAAEFGDWSQNTAVEARGSGHPPPKSAGVLPARHEEASNGLDLAAECLQKGDSLGAIAHLRFHMRRFPEQIMIRAYLAELLFKAGEWAEAQDNFDRFIAAAQDSDGPARQHIVHCHTRLMEVAQQRGDAYGEHLHRGIGMVLLVRRLDGAGASSDVEPGFRERMLCKAAAELTRASRRRPDEPRPHVYLTEVWRQLDQPRQREQAALRAKERMALLPLPPAEERGLLTAAR